jgi:hypothetical protein
MDLTKVCPIAFVGLDSRVPGGPHFDMSTMATCQELCPNHRVDGTSTNESHSRSFRKNCDRQFHLPENIIVNLQQGDLETAARCD